MTSHNTACSSQAKLCCTRLSMASSHLNSDPSWVVLSLVSPSFRSPALTAGSKIGHVTLFYITILILWTKLEVKAVLNAPCGPNSIIKSCVTITWMLTALQSPLWYCFVCKLGVSHCSVLSVYYIYMPLVCSFCWYLCEENPTAETGHCTRWCTRLATAVVISKYFVCLGLVRECDLRSVQN